MSDENPSNFSFNYETRNEFFVGNLNKTKTRDEIFKELTAIYIDSLGKCLYIKKFNMPKFNARRDSNGNLILNSGYAFVTTSEQEMAMELIKLGRLKMKDGTDLEFKPINKAKRLIANQKCKEKNYEKINNVDRKNRDNNNNNMKNGYNNNSNWKNSDTDTNWRNSTDINNLVGEFGSDRKYPRTGDSNDRLWPSFHNSNNFTYNNNLNSNSSSSVSPNRTPMTNRKSLFDEDYFEYDEVLKENSESEG